MVDRGGRPWFEVAFEETYAAVYAHRSEQAAVREVCFAREELGLSPGDRVLDLACGAGRHLRALQAAGLKAVGVDLSWTLLRRGRDPAGPPQVRGDMRALPFKDRIFAAVLSFFTSFGYFESDGEDAQVVAEIARVLGRGGRFLLDYLDAEQARNQLVPRSERHRQGLHIVEERRVEGSRVKKRVRITGVPGRTPLTYEESVRLYTPRELQGLLEAAGLRVIRTLRGFPPIEESKEDRCLLLAEKPA